VTCCCRHAHAHGEGTHRAATGDAWRWWIDVVAGDRSARIELRRLVPVRVDGLDVVRLDDVWAASHLGPASPQLRFDFVSDDGFRLGAKRAGGLEATALSTGYMRIDTRDLVWQPVPERPCFWRVKRVARMLASPAPIEAGVGA